MAKIGAVFGRMLADAKIFDIGKVLQQSSAKLIEPALVAIITSVGSKVLENLVLKS
jgi:orotidine-5'-phosphate decarboxylase